jgi:hypothetical protein
MEVQTLTLDVGGDFALFQDLGTYGSSDQLTGALNLYNSTVRSGHLYGVRAPHVTVHARPWLLWYVTLPQNYTGNVSPDSPHVSLIP